MLVETDGSGPNEGFTGPAVTNPGSPVPASISIELLGVGGGSVTVSAVSSTTGTIFGTTVVALTDLWQRAQVSGFTVGAGDGFYILVQTATPQALVFWADAAQMELNVTTASAYIDGDQHGCRWLGTPELSVSVQSNQNPASASGFMVMSGRATPLDVGEVFAASASGSMVMGGDAAPENATPVAAFDDFALFELTDPDPAMAYADQNNAGAHSGHTNYAQNYGLFVPPADCIVSDGSYLWRRAQYMAAGFEFAAVATTQEQNITRAQVSLCPITGSTLVPDAYTPPRQIQAVIKPTRLNFVTNPAFAVDNSGWSGIGGGSVARDTTTVTPAPGWLTVAEAGSVGTMFNAVAVSADGTTGTGNFDGTRASYSETALERMGITPGSTQNFGGVQFTWSNVGPGELDNIQCNGQVIPCPAPAGATVVTFLGAASNGGTIGVTGTVTITYTDGTTDTGTLSFTDWTLDGDTSAVLFGNLVVAQMPYLNHQDGTSPAVKSYLFTNALAVNPAKSVASVTLPVETDLHVFAVSLAEPDGLLAGSDSGDVTMTADGDGISISVPDLILGDTYVASLFIQSGPGLAVLTASCADGEATLSQFTGGVPYGGEPGIGYGQGFYGGVGGGTNYSDDDYGSGSYGGEPLDIPTGIWSRLAFTFTANASTVTLSVIGVGSADVSYNTNFWVTGVMVEAGTELLDYFDGSYGGTDYLDFQWEGTAGKSRSYFYQQFAVKKYTVNKVLAKHTPLGITYAAPVYLQVYTQ